MRKKLTLVLILAITLSTISATQYVRADVGFSYEIVHPSDADIRYIGSDNAPDGLRVLRADSSNSSVSLEFGKWSRNQTKTYTAAFGIVNEEMFPITITDLEVLMDGSDPDYMQIWLHAHEDTLAEYEAAGNAVFMWNQGVNPNDLTWTLGPGNQNPADASFGPTPWDINSQVRYGSDTIQGAVQGISDFVWVQISLVVPGDADINQISGTIIFSFQDSSPIQQVNADIWVDDDKAPEWYDATHVKTISEAIINATDGQTVYVYAGSYPQMLTVSKSLTFIGEAGKYPKINPNIGTGTSTAISITASGVSFSGFNISNGNKIRQGQGIWDGSWVPTNKDLVINNCLFSFFERAIRYYSPIVVTNSSFIDNSRNGIYLSGPAAGEGGSNIPLPFTISNNSFWSSQATGSDAAIQIKYKNRYGEISYNYIADFRNGIWIDTGGVLSGQVLISHNTIVGSYAFGNNLRNITVGISLYATSSNFANYTIRDNIFYYAKWYAIYQESSSAITGGPAIISNNLFYDNYWYYWNLYQYPYQWNGTGISNGVVYGINDVKTIVCWSAGPSIGAFDFNNNIFQNPLLNLSTPGITYFSLTNIASPAYQSASDGTNIGAWQGTL